MPEPFRLPPAMPVHAYKTYAISSPITTHTRPARCEEVNCLNHTNGWVTKIDTSQPLGATQAKYITEQAGRYYTASIEGPLLVFTFPAGQQCFAQHRVPLHREPLYVVRDGDWRGNPTGQQRRHSSADAWVDDFRTHQEEIEKG